ncbi:MAG: RdgB/HAM1 family non-canonical purine NTP pyrophosphatase [Acidimicrobiia bacterium]
MRYLLASGNPDKLREIAAILAGAGIEVESPEWMPEVEETGKTLEDNARLKARALVDLTGRPALADDTGLEVEALDGAPGVRAARYAGPGATYSDNVDKLLGALAGVVPDRRRARFATVALALFPDGREIVAHGLVEGTIALSPRGAEGFGYDPIFVPEGSGGRTFAELTLAGKEALSHRGRAFGALAAALALSPREAGEVGKAEDGILAEARRGREGVRACVAVLEAVLAGTSPDDPEAWWRTVGGPLVRLDEAFERHVDLTERPNGLFAEIIEEAPRLAHACRDLELEHEAIRCALDAALELQAKAEEAGGAVGELLSMLSQHRHRGANLMFEAYSVDVSTGD